MTHIPFVKRQKFADEVWADRTAEAVILTCMAVIAIFVPLRVYRRLVVTGSWGLDDCEHEILSVPYSRLYSFLAAFVPRFPESPRYLYLRADCQGESIRHLHRSRGKFLSSSTEGSGGGCRKWYGTGMGEA
jgi:hypothetical protein